MKTLESHYWCHCPACRWARMNALARLGRWLLARWELWAVLLTLAMVLAFVFGFRLAMWRDTGRFFGVGSAGGEAVTAFAGVEDELGDGAVATDDAEEAGFSGGALELILDGAAGGAEETVGGNPSAAVAGDIDEEPAGGEAEDGGRADGGGDVIGAVDLAGSELLEVGHGELDVALERVGEGFVGAAVVAGDTDEFPAHEEKAKGEGRKAKGGMA